MLRSVPLALLVSAVTATAGPVVAPAPAQAANVFADLSSPTITGTAVEGQTLSEVHAVWSTPPASDVIQWDRCNSSGNDCESISKATSQTYRLTAADVGFTIRVGESASDAAGAVTPAMSEPTAVVQAQGTSEHGGGSGGGGSTPPVKCCEAPAHVGQAEIKRLLARQLAPLGKKASISSLLEHGGLGMGFKLPEAGALSVGWYLVRPSAKMAKTTRDKPILVAAGQAKLAAAAATIVEVRLTAQGRKLLRHATKIDLEARGAFATKGETGVSAARKFTLERRA